MIAVSTESNQARSTPTVTIAYDGTTISGCSPTLTAALPIGRRTSMCDAGGWEAWSYDSRGHVITERRNTNSVTKSTAYTYNFHGGVTSITYPSGRTVSYTYNAAGQTLSAADTANSITYASSAAYNPAGALTSLQEGANLVSTMYYNNRLQPCRISVASSGTAPTACTDSAHTGNVMDFTYGFNWGAADNGNVQSIANNITAARSQTYTYDELNRVSTAKTTATSGTYSWGLQFGYDPWANLLTTTVTQGSAYAMSVTADGSNRIHSTTGSFTYDAAGNLTADPVNSSYTYNAEGELTSAAGVTYTYDGDGSRVKKSSGKLYWYGNGTDPLSESDSSGNLTNEYIFLSGKRIAMLQLSSSTVNYYIADHLGSSRIVTNSSGAVLDDSDFYPYGGERSYSASSGNNYKFAGKERDTESGLDDFAARFYTSNYGRFISADESKYAHPPDPQSWNLYTYVANNPINAVDPTGHDPSNCRSCNFPKDAFSGDSEGSVDRADGEAGYDADITYTQNCIQDLEQCKQDEEEQATQQQTQKEQTAEELASQVPENVKKEMQASVSDSNKGGGFHEEGGDWGENDKGKVLPERWNPGPDADPRVEDAHIYPFSEAKEGEKLTYMGDWHTHPRGFKVDKDGVHGFRQEPDDVDEAGAKEHPGGIHIVLGTADRKVYFYNGEHVIGSVTFKSFGLK